MTPELTQQAARLAAAAGLGLGLGILYDLFRGARREGAGRLPDAVFALLFLVTLLALTVYGRGLRLYQLLGLGLGSGLWFLTGSSGFLPRWRRILRRLAALGRAGGRIRRKTVKKLRKVAKKLFSYQRKWGTIRDVPCSPGTSRAREGTE